MQSYDCNKIYLARPKTKFKLLFPISFTRRKNLFETSSTFTASSTSITFTMSITFTTSITLTTSKTFTTSLTKGSQSCLMALNACFTFTLLFMEMAFPANPVFFFILVYPVTNSSTVIAPSPSLSRVLTEIFCLIKSRL